jgi:hypothetical protein
VSTRTPFMAGNWKMNPTTLEECESLSALLRTTAENLKRDKPDLDVEVRYNASAQCGHTHSDDMLNAPPPKPSTRPPREPLDAQTRDVYIQACSLLLAMTPSFRTVRHWHATLVAIHSRSAAPQHTSPSLNSPTRRGATQ